MNFLQSAYYKIKKVFGIGIVDSILKVYPRIYMNPQILRGGLGAHRNWWNIWSWYNVYSGSPPWYEGCDKETVYKLPVAKTVCEYLSTYNTAECKLEVTPKNWAQREYETDELGNIIREIENDITETPVYQFIESVISESAFYDNIAKIDEQKEALGDFFIKPYIDEGITKWDYVPITQFWPISWDNRRFLEGVFESTIIRDKYIYTHLEAHQFDVIDWMDGKPPRKSLVIEKKLFRDRKDNGEVTAWEPVSLKSKEARELGLYDENPRMIFDRNKPIFCHMYPASANNKDINSPLHLSRFANSYDTLKAIDKAYNEWQQARIDSRIRAVAPAEWFRRDLGNGPDGNARVFFDTETKVWQALNYKDRETQKLDYFQPDYIIEKYITDLNADFDLLAQQTGVASGTYSFSRNGISARTFTRTAEEVQSLNATTFATVRKNQAINREAFKDLLSATVFLGLEYNLIDDSYAKLTEDDFEYNVEFDDSIKQSHESQINEGIKLYEAGIISHEEFLTEYYQLTKDAAQAMISQINNEKQAARSTVPNMFGNYENTGD